MTRKCSYCDGTGIEKLWTYPFERVPEDHDISIRSAKMAINTMYHWKNNPNPKSKYDPKALIDDISKFCAILEYNKVIDAKQVDAILRYLMNV